MSHYNFLNFGIFRNCPIKIDLSGNTVWPQVSGLQKIAKIDHFWHFIFTFVCSKCHIWIFEFWHFSSFFAQLELTCLVALFCCKFQVFGNLPKLIILSIFNELLSTKNVAFESRQKFVKLWLHFSSFLLMRFFMTKLKIRIFGMNDKT